MSSINNLKAISPILAQYSVEPHFVEDVGKIQKIYSNKGEFALKKIPPSQGTDFIRHVQYLYQKGYNRIVPIYPTVDGRYAVLYQNMLYYLMPWLPNAEKEDNPEKHKQLFRELARLHTLSVREIPIKKEERKEHYENTILLWEKDEEFLTGFLEECENKWYMSPFELQFCLYYNEAVQAIKFSKRKLETWYEKTKDQEKARMVTVHGKFSPEHFLYDEKGYGYFMNFESAKQGSPIHDLLPYLSRALKGYPKKSEESIEWAMTYTKYFPLKEDEMHLLMSYFSHPAPFIKAVQAYHKRQPGKKEQKLVQHLLRQYWHLKNTEYVVMRLEEIEVQKKQAQEQAQQAQQEGAQ